MAEEGDPGWISDGVMSKLKTEHARLTALTLQDLPLHVGTARKWLVEVRARTPPSGRGGGGRERRGSLGPFLGLVPEAGGVPCEARSSCSNTVA